MIKTSEAHMKLWQFAVLAVLVVLVSLFIVNWYFFPQANLFHVGCFFGKAADFEFKVTEDTISFKGTTCSYSKAAVPKNVASWTNSGNPHPKAEPDGVLDIDSVCFNQFGKDPDREFLVFWKDQVGFCQRTPVA